MTEHQLEAICGQDTLQQKFTLFSMKDTHPVEPTTEWYYQTAKTLDRKSTRLNSSHT